MQPPGRAAAEEAAGRDLLAADLRCSLFAAALRSYKRDSALRPFPAAYARGDCKDFEALLADASKLPSLKELLSSGDKDRWAWDLLSWILSSKVLTIHSTGKAEFEKIQQLTGSPHTPVPVPDFLFEIEYFNPANAKFYETKGERDLIYAFHGSRLENFHSIIHNGLHCHLNKTSLFGEGTYLTSDLSLALIYSPHGHGWQHSLLGPILSCVAVCEVIDHPDVKCQTKKKDSKELDRSRVRIKHSEGGDIPPKYFVVTNNQLLRVKYLLVYSQKQPKRQPWTETSESVSQYQPSLLGCLLTAVRRLTRLQGPLFYKNFAALFRTLLSCHPGLFSQKLLGSSVDSSSECSLCNSSTSPLPTFRPVDSAINDSGFNHRAS
ncbi:protein mono-ADP-ribosyltransferase PARP16 isoform X1 [Cavia porcellus]|uniref:protein mono-ADP-ribosyltransferase PARP16 isoform X1 n=1 Tax=Cavia porcellus TaxID=10141 RepID=UPI000661FA11|nr:mono [ADP-ribose] polymerase PARP16 isoform X1 [Cavia porcellus]